MKLKKVKKRSLADHPQGCHFIARMTDEQEQFMRDLLGAGSIWCSLCGEEAGGNFTSRREVIPELDLIKKVVILRAVCGKCFDDFKRTWKMFAKVMTITKKEEKKMEEVTEDCDCDDWHDIECAVYLKAQNTLGASKLCLCIGGPGVHNPACPQHPAKEEVENK